MTNESEELTYMERIARVTGIPLEYIQKFQDLGLMNEIEARNALIRSEYFQLKKEGVTVRHSMALLREKYNIEMRQLQNIVHFHVKAVHYCKYCGKQITNYYVTHHNGVCPQCIENRKQL